MSEFDEEAERERLRERFEREEQKREATERMSELLLKGATMTNAHCSDCGDPIFRYDGQEFCATCQKPVEREEGERDGEGADEDDDAESPANVEVTSPSDDARVQFGGVDEQGNTSAPDVDAPDASEAEGPAQGRTAPADSQPADDVGAAVASARADLAATLQRFARAARESDSPTAAKAHLEAAREAGEALDELD